MGLYKTLQKVDSDLQRVGETHFTSDSHNLVGTGGTQSLIFKALQAGTTTLTLVYHRPWENFQLIDTFSVTLTVK